MVAVMMAVAGNGLQVLTGGGGGAVKALAGGSH